MGREPFAQQRLDLSLELAGIVEDLDRNPGTFIGELLLEERPQALPSCLRAIELDKRREVGVIVKERAAAKHFREIFEQDWANTETGRKALEKAKEKEKEKDKDKEAALAAS